MIDIDIFIKKFEEECPNNLESEYYILDNEYISSSYSLHHLNKARILSLIIDLSDDYVPSNSSSIGCIVLDWYKSYAGTKTMNGISVIQRQAGYQLSNEWINQISNVEYPYKWFLNIENSEETQNWSKIITPISKTVAKSLDPSFRKKTVFLALPQICKDKCFPDWNNTLEKSRFELADIVVCDLGFLLCKKIFSDSSKKNKRLYIISLSTDEELLVETVNICAYEQRNENQIVSVDSLTFLPREDVCIHTHLAAEETITFGEQTIAEQLHRELDFMWNPISSTMYENVNKRLFLERNTPFFGLEYWSLVDETQINSNSKKIKAIAKILREYGSQTTEVICSKVCNADLLNIALEDLIIIATELEKCPNFKKTTLSTKRESSLKSMDIAVEDWVEDIIGMIPSNYYNFEWKTKKYSGYIGSYHKINPNRMNFQNLVLAIVEHFDYCTTYTVAEEVLSFFKVSGDPSAYFTAKVFLYLSGCDNLLLFSKTTDAIVETYADEIKIDVVIEKINSITNKMPEEKKQPISDRRQTSDWFGKSIIKEDSETLKTIDMTIEELDLSVRSYNCLKRAGINSVDDLRKLTKTDLLKVRNFGENGVAEVERYLKEIGIFLKASADTSV